MRTGYADLPLHYGHAPRWLFERMVKLSRNITEIIVLEYGKDEFLRRLSDPYFFQAFSCVIGFDYHSSGTTTTTMGALKTAKLDDLGVTILGGKGKESTKTPEEVLTLAEKFSLSGSTISELQNASRMAAKVDNSCLQDGYQLYHHTLVVTEDGKWSVVQQGLNPDNKYARRYHWLSEKVETFVVEPHAAIACDMTGKTLNLVANESDDVRKACVDLIKEDPQRLIRHLQMPANHHINLKNYKALMGAHEFQPETFEQLIGIKGMGPKNIRALALLTNILFGTNVSWRDPAKYSFAHGGKDRIPYPVDRDVYDRSIEILKSAVDGIRRQDKEKVDALRRLSKFYIVQ